ncbi:recombination regulator RecX [Hydrogenophaga sp.]|uniref:recombination regulator RecX n=1 Tax=Hydrogenophaga sp. TaxID=1904254 RepID=UPI0026365941|nr:recombination regulator RecX [Hydrogenophaga sp.]MCW5654972.1 recombination regulator RecX [Hydrogenophaga sp.]
MGSFSISLKGRALKLLAAREHSRAELQRKLAPHETEPGELARALDELQSKGFIDEQRVIDSVLHRRASRLGASRVRQELQAKGLDPQAVANAVAALKDTELARAHDVWRRKFGRAPGDAVEQARQMRFLLTRGFGAETVRRVVRGTAVTDDGAD